MSAPYAMLFVAVIDCVVLNHSELSQLLIVFAMVVVAALAWRFGWWSIDDDDNFRAIVPIVVMSLVGWWPVRPRSLPRTVLPPLFLALACAFFMWSNMPQSLQL